MKVELTKADLISLVKGTTPSYKAMQNPIVKANGSYTGGHHDKWDWDFFFDKSLTEQQLWELYMICNGNNMSRFFSMAYIHCYLLVRLLSLKFD